MFVIQRQSTTGLFVVIDTDTGRALGRGELPQEAINSAIVRGMPAENRQALLIEARAIVDQENTAQPPLDSSAAQTVQDDAPTGPSAQLAATTPVAVNVSNTDTGTNSPVRTLEQTQATTNQNGNSVGILLPDETGIVGTIRKNPETGELYDSAGLNLATSPGTGAGDDSASQAGPGTGNTAINNATAAGSSANNAIFKQIIPQPNVLDNFQNYTYHASVYMMTPTQANTLALSNRKTVNGYYLLFQSGGAPPNTGGPPTGNLSDAGRNPAFPNDFYIDSITIENFLSGSQKTAHATSSIKFAVVEPAGITLIDNLYAAVQQIMGGNTGPINYNAITYLMIIRFYGYDQDGNIVSGIGGPSNSAVIEKFIPFRLSKVDFSIQNKLVTYNFEGMPMGAGGGNGVAYGTRRGTIPYDMQLTAVTLDQLLGSKTAVTESNSNSAPENSPGATTTTGAALGPAPPTADAAASMNSSLQQGLAAALNKFQQELVRNGTYDVADIYEIVLDPEIAKSKIVPPGSKVEKRHVPVGPANVVQALDIDRLSVEQNAKSMPIVAGMQIVQVIDLAIRNSNYMIGQQNLLFNSQDVSESNGGSSGKPVTWFNITFATTQLAYDRKRNDYGFKITYTVKPFQIDNYYSRYFPVNKFRGLHKSYPYWFTGKNIAVLEYQETLNNLYNLTVSGNEKIPNLSDRQRRTLTSSMREIPFVSFASRSSESSQGSEARQYEGVANLAESLYDPIGLANSKIKIVGDPAWMAQGRASSGVTSTDLSNPGFGPDGTINFDHGQVLFEVVWQKPQDYDLDTGLADPYKNKSKQPQQSRVYTATKCTSEFRQGRFEQTLEGLLYKFIKTPNPNNKAASALVPSNVGSSNADGGADGGADGQADAGALASSVPGTRFDARPPTASTASGVDDQIAANGSFRGLRADVLGVANSVGGLGFANSVGGLSIAAQRQNVAALSVPTTEVISDSISDGTFAVPSSGSTNQTTSSNPPMPSTTGDGQTVGIATRLARSAALIASVAVSNAAPQDIVKDA